MVGMRSWECIFYVCIGIGRFQIEPIEPLLQTVFMLNNKNIDNRPMGK